MSILASCMLLTVTYLSLLDKDISEIYLLSNITHTQKVGDQIRSYREIVLDSNRGGITKFTISMPETIPDDMSYIILIDGIETGQEALKYAPHPKNMAVIAYEFPKALQYLRKKSILFHLRSARKAATQVPSQVLSIIKFLKRKPYSNEKPVIIMGLSFGSIFVPSIYRVAHTKGMELGPGIMAFGGADLYEIFYHNLKGYGFFRKPIAYFGSRIFKPIDPLVHAAHIQGDFLIINGSNDEYIPIEAAKKLQELIPEPKTIINIQDTHIMTEKAKTIKKINDITLDWLSKQSTK